MLSPPPTFPPSWGQGPLALSGRQGEAQATNRTQHGRASLRLRCGHGAEFSLRGEYKTHSESRPLPSKETACLLLGLLLPKGRKRALCGHPTSSAHTGQHPGEGRAVRHGGSGPPLSPGLLAPPRLPVCLQGQPSGHSSHEKQQASCWLDHCRLGSLLERLSLRPAEQVSVWVSCRKGQSPRAQPSDLSQRETPVRPRFARPV